MTRTLLLTALIATTMLATAQEKPLATISLKGTIQWAGIDRPGDISLVMQDGTILKYDKEGKLAGQYHFASRPTLYDPLDGAQSFFYQRDNNTFGVLDGAMTEATTHPVDPAFAIQPWLVCPALKELWILDAADFNIKKTKLNANAISLESQLKHLPQKKIEDYTSMREYQNYIFLLDQNAGIHVFNSLGRFVRTVGEKNIPWFNFLGEELYYPSEGKLIFFDLYSAESRTVAVPRPGAYMLVTDERLYIADGSTLYLYPFHP